MSIRHYNPGRNRRGRVSIAAERFLYVSLLLSIASQIVFLFNQNANFILASATFASVFSLAHAQLAFAKRYFWSYLIFVLLTGFLIELISINTGICCTFWIIDSDIFPWSAPFGCNIPLISINNSVIVTGKQIGRAHV